MRALSMTDREKVFAEIAPYHQLDASRKWMEIRRACQAAAKMLALRPDAERVLALVDPLPPRSVEILAALRASARE